MKFEDFNHYTVQRVIRSLGSEFYTVDVAKHPAMRRAHGVSEASDDWNNYLQMTGKYLHAHEHDLDLTLMDNELPRRGRRWVKRGYESPTGSPTPS
jgi:hypothetical protein